ncbi:MAG: shikimate dehydrogenase [Eubacterium sp.]|nr:shikimate dehydrogenase [Eubacterium sp.]
MEYQISGHTKLFALIGTPVAHSLSPAMHNYSFQKLGLDCVYVALDVPAEKTAKAVEAIRTLGICGCNVTMPHKTAVVPYLDELSPAAQMTGAVNTIVNRDGVLAGHTTDGEGFVLNLADHGVDVAGKQIVVAGAGGAATAVQVQCALSGAAGVHILQRAGKSYARAQKTAETIRKEVPSCAADVTDLNDTEAVTACVRRADILINGTSVGMKPADDQSIIKDAGAFHAGLVVADAVYNPVETRLLQDAKAAGCQCVDGTGMLLWQGVAAFRLFTGMEMPAEEVKTLFFK